MLQQSSCRCLLPYHIPMIDSMHTHGPCTTSRRHKALTQLTCLLSACSYAQKVLVSIIVESYSSEEVLPVGALAALSSFLGWKCMDKGISMAYAGMTKKGRLKSAVSFSRAIHSSPTGALVLPFVLFWPFHLMSFGIQCWGTASEASRPCSC